MSWCAPAGHAFAFGFDQFTNYGRATVVLSRVALLHPRNERIIGNFAVPGDRVLGVMRWFPKNPPTQPAWRDRRPVRGFRLAPGKTFNLVLGVAAVIRGQLATSKNELVYYHDSSGRYVAKSYQSDIIASNTHSC